MNTGFTEMWVLDTTVRMQNLVGDSHAAASLRPSSHLLPEARACRAAARSLVTALSTPTAVSAGGSERERVILIFIIVDNNKIWNLQIKIFT